MRVFRRVSVLGKLPRFHHGTTSSATRPSSSHPRRRPRKCREEPGPREPDRAGSRDPAGAGRQPAAERAAGLVVLDLPGLGRPGVGLRIPDACCRGRPDRLRPAPLLLRSAWTRSFLARCKDQVRSALCRPGAGRFPFRGVKAPSHVDRSAWCVDDRGLQPSRPFSTRRWPRQFRGAGARGRVTRSARSCSS